MNDEYVGALKVSDIFFMGKIHILFKYHALIYLHYACNFLYKNALTLLKKCATIIYSCNFILTTNFLFRKTVIKGSRYFMRRASAKSRFRGLYNIQNGKEHSEQNE